MGATIEVNIWFICIIQARRELPGTRTGVVQLRGRPTLVSIPVPPEKALVNGLPSAAVLWQAEAMFLERQDEFYPEHEVIAWEARYLKPDGPLLSQFRVLLPAQED